MGQRKEYDSNALVWAIARGDRPISEIAHEFHLSYQHVAGISKGRFRKELHPQIQALREIMLEEARAMARRLARPAMVRLGRLIADDTTPTAEVQRKAAVDILRYAIGDPSKPEINVLQAQQIHQPDLTDLSPATKRLVLKELGGPLPEDDAPEEDADVGKKG